MTREERLAFLKGRQSGIGGSDVAAVCGLDEYRTPMDVYLEKTRDPNPDSPTNIHLLRGEILEPIAADLWQKETGLKLRRMGQRAHKEFPWAVVNADRQILSGNGHGTGALEIKAPGIRGFNKAVEEGLRDEYIVQLQWALFVTGYSWGEMCAINLEHEAGPLLHFPVERDDALIAELRDRCESFWNGHVRERRPPDPSLWKVERIEIDPVPGEIVTVEDGTVKKLVESIEIVKEAKKEAEQTLAALNDDLLDWMKAHEVGKLDAPGVGRATRIVGKGRERFNQGQFEAYGALDPDAVSRLLEEMEAPRGLAYEIQSQCQLDLSIFKTRGDDFEYVRTYPKKKGD